MPDSQKPFDRAEADVLRQKYIAGELSESEAARLLVWIHERPEQGEALLDDLSLDAMLREVGKAGALTMPENVIVLPQVSRRWPAIAGWAALAACIAVLATLGVQQWIIRGGSVHVFAGGSTAEATTRAVAVLKRAVNVEWNDSGPARSAGALLEPGVLHLKSGLVQVEFFTGARVLLEGPAELRLVSSGEAYCAAGKLSAEVPPQARGFRIGTPQGVVVDLGTEFGVNVDAAGSEVHVMKGEVELHRASTQRSLREGQAVALVNNGEVRELAANAAAFASRSEIERKARDLQRVQMERWRLAAGRWNYDPSLLVRFDFEPADTSVPTLRNVALPGGQPSAVADAAIVGCSWTGGRWAGKRALEFRGVGDRVRLEVPGELSYATLAAWVRVDGLDRQFNSLFMCEGFSSGDLHWQIDRRGFARLGVGGEGDRDSPVLFTPESYGRWVHLAVVYDSPGGEVRHYADGKLVARVPLLKKIVLRLGMAELGNWSPGSIANSSNIRHFSGAMDEFLLFSRALSDEEIKSIYSAGTLPGAPEQKVAAYPAPR